MAGRPWTPEEDAEICRRWRPGMPRAEGETVAGDLGRTFVAVHHRAIKLGMVRRKKPPWSPEDLAYLRDNFCRLPIKAMAKHLNRSIDAVKLKGQRIGLRRRRDRPGLVPREIGDMLGMCSKKVKAWIRGGRLPATRLNSRYKRAIHLVSESDLAEFLRANLDTWDATRCPDLPRQLDLQVRTLPIARKLGAEAVLRLDSRPLWFRQKLAADRARPPFPRRWTPEEDRQLTRLIRQGLRYPEIGRRLGRTPAAVDHRAARLRQLDRHFAWAASVSRGVNSHM